MTDGPLMDADCVHGHAWYECEICRTSTPAPRYDRALLVSTLVHHWPTSTSGCRCGWAELGRSHPEHVADVYEASLAQNPPGQVDR